ncbi:MAG: transporter substrate-binding domain-containing protein [Myxococcales bacterium]
MTRDPFSLVGTAIDGKYRIDEVVGEGGFGVVYRGHHLSFEKTIAIKCLKVPSHFTPEASRLFRERFRAEGKLLFSLSDHASVVHVLDFGLIGGTIPYLVLEWLEGKDLSTIFADNRLRRLPPYDEMGAVHLLAPVIDALALAHSLKLAHRDIKPANLFRVQSPRGTTLKVLDFGIAKAMQEGETATQLATRTSSGFSAFSPNYGAPEQFYAKRFGPTGPWTDVHALGLILVELVTGRPAYDGDEHAEWYEAAVRPQRPTPRARGANVSDFFEAVCARALASHPAHRFQDASALLAALQPMLAARFSQQTAQPPPRATSPTRVKEPSGWEPPTVPRPANPPQRQFFVPFLMALVAMIALFGIGALIVGSLKSSAPVGSKSATSSPSVLSSTPPVQSAAASDAAPALAMSSAPTRQNVLASIRKSGRLRVGVEDEAPPLNYVDEATKTRMGFDYELISDMAKRMKIPNVEVVEGKFDELPGMLAEGKVDIFMSGWVPDLEVEKKWNLVWSDPYLKFGYCLIVRKGTAIRELRHLTGRKVGIYKGDNPLKLWVTENVVGFSALVEEDGTGWFRILEEQKVDAILYDYPFAVEEVKKAPDLRIVKLNLNAREYAIGLPAGNPALLNALNAVLAETSGSPLYKQLIQKYLKSDSLDVGVVPMGAKKHVVKSGETLGIIALAELGDANKWIVLWELNKSRIAHPDLISAGNVLLLP